MQPSTAGLCNLGFVKVSSKIYWQMCQKLVSVRSYWALAAAVRVPCYIASNMMDRLELDPGYPDPGFVTAWINLYALPD